MPVAQEEKKKEVFTATVNDKEVKIAVERPSQEKMAEAQKIYNSTFRDAIESRAIVRAKIEKVMREQELWDDAMQKDYDDLRKKVDEARKKINKGGLKVDEARKTAFECRENEARLRLMRATQNSLDANTAESQAENARFNRLISLCTVYNDTGKPYFANHKEFLEKTNDPVGIEAGSKLAYLVYNLDPNYEANLPENKFLKQWKMVDEQLRPINKEGHLVDLEGKLIDENGRFVDKDGNYVDRDGNLIDEKGNYLIEEATPFLDENGNPVYPPGQEIPPIDASPANVG